LQAIPDSLPRTHKHKKKKKKQKKQTNKKTIITQKESMKAIHLAHT